MTKLLEMLPLTGRNDIIDRLRRLPDTEDPSLNQRRNAL
jgi:hypothetical protein